jgi:hypothetical protein
VRKSLLQKSVLVFLAIVGVCPLLYFVSVEVGIAQPAGDTSGVGEGIDSFDRYVENVAFGVNEKLTFDISYGFINAGTATLEVARLIDYESRPCYQVVSRAQSNSFFSTFYKVDDRVESIVDAIGIFSWRFEKNLREGTYRSDRMCTFDQRRHLVFYRDDTISTPSFVQDALSVLYYVRTQKLKPGTSLFIDNFTDGKLYPLEVKVLRRERVTVKAGTFDCLVVEPLLQSVGVFRHEGKLTVWLTDDRLKLPVLMKSKILVGSISAELTAYQLGDIEAF